MCVLRKNMASHSFTSRVSIREGAFDSPAYVVELMRHKELHSVLASSVLKDDRKTHMSSSSTGIVRR